jgi:hypothetical protein
MGATTFNNNALKHLTKSELKKWYKNYHPEYTTDEVTAHYNIMHPKKETQKK